MIAMMTFRDHNVYVFRCPNPDCRTDIYIRHSSPEGIYAGPTRVSRDEFPLRIVCHVCGHWSLHNYSGGCEVNLPIPQPASQGHTLRQPASWSIEMICGQCNCKPHPKWHIGDDSNM